MQKYSISLLILIVIVLFCLSIGCTTSKTTIKTPSSQYQNFNRSDIANECISLIQKGEQDKSIANFKFNSSFSVLDLNTKDNLALSFPDFGVTTTGGEFKGSSSFEEYLIQYYPGIDYSNISYSAKHLPPKIVFLVESIPLEWIGNFSSFSEAYVIDAGGKKKQIMPPGIPAYIGEYKIYVINYAEKRYLGMKTIISKPPESIVSYQGKPEPEKIIGNKEDVSDWIKERIQ